MKRKAQGFGHPFICSFTPKWIEYYAMAWLGCWRDMVVSEADVVSILMEHEPAMGKWQRARLDWMVGSQGTPGEECSQTGKQSL